MEINYEEIDNLGDNRQGNFDITAYESLNEDKTRKYWESIKKVENKRKKVSFDDILSNMNLVVNQNGVLQYMEPIQNNYINNNEEYNYNYNQLNQPQQVSQNQPLDPNVKHSYIFNKYFKDYKDANTLSVPVPRVPQSLEEYRQMVIEDKIKAIQQRNRIAQIKSTKMLYTNNITNSGVINTNGNLRASRNNLRSMSFR
jgi:Fe-S cluster assembly iron-binding protein IscA